MIIFRHDRVPDLRHFGIEVPIMADRKLQTFEFLINHAQLGSRISDWHSKWEPTPITKEDLLRVHSSIYVEKLLGKNGGEAVAQAFELYDENGKPHRYSPHNAVAPLSDLRDEVLLQCDGTIRACEVALEKGFAYYLGGGMHHAMADFGAGFCVVNDIVIAIRRLQSEDKVTKVWVIDVDAHKGDGTANLTESDSSISTLSIHMAKGWPLEGPRFLANGKPNPSFTPSTIDIGIGVGEEATYLLRLAEGLRDLEKISNVKPDLAIVVNGSDPYEGDVLPSASLLKLTLPQMLERDTLVYSWLRERNIPQAYVMAGGYGPNVWKVHSQFIEWVLLQRV